jgi:hypothetical protein
VLDVIQTLLYDALNLTSGSHFLILTNGPAEPDHTWVDVDYIVSPFFLIVGIVTVSQATSDCASKQERHTLRASAAQDPFLVD